MSAFILKIIAVISMTFDHLSYLIFGELSFMNYIGRIAFPIFAYQITEGYIHTHNLKKYFLRLFIFALISQIPFMLFASIYTSSFHLNIFFTLLLGLVSITIYEKLNNIEFSKTSQSLIIHRLFQLLGIIICFAIAFFSNYIKCDYRYFGVLSIFFFYLFRNNLFLMNASFVLLVIIYYGKELLFSPFFNIYLWIVVFTIVPLLFINLYNHKKGKDTKYFLYLFYPLHFLIIYALNLLLK